MAQHRIAVEELAQVRQLVVSGEARRVREAAGITQSELARDIGCSQAAVTRWEANTRTPTGRIAVAYLRALRRLQAVSALWFILSLLVLVIPLAEDQPTMDVDAAGRACGLGRDAAYRAAHRYLETDGREGLPTLRFGRTLRCPTAALRQLLGLMEPDP